MKRAVLSVLLLSLPSSLGSLSAAVASAEEPIDWEMVNRIRDEGFQRSQVMETLRHLTDDIGPRLTGSPAMKAANEWTRDQLAGWGLVAAVAEPWGEFGRGWSFDRAALHVLRPRATPLSALPTAWTPGTAGPVRGLAVRVDLGDDGDLEKQRGKLRGKVLLLDEDREVRDADQPEFSRYDRESLDEVAGYPIGGGGRPDFRRRGRGRREFQKKLNEFLVAEGVLATLSISGRDSGILRLGGAGSREPGESTGVTALVVAAEQYRWLLRLLEGDGEVEPEVELEVEVGARFYDDDLMAYNTVAEIPGTDLRDQVVMVGAHLDSWHAAAGSNDNGAGSAVAMEAVRILKALGVRPRRTIRIALWTGEEQGLLGSRAYVEKHFATRPEPTDPEERKLPRSLWNETWPIEYRPDHAKFSAYFNMDNGSGKFRGIYTQGNVATVPIFERWLLPFNDLGADTVTNRNTGGTDHQSFDRYGLPGFQFIQDELDYSSRTHHTNLDHYDHARAEDLKQASVVMASFLYHAAMRDDKLPRKPQPQPRPAARDRADGRQ